MLVNWFYFIKSDGIDFQFALVNCDSIDQYHHVLWSKIFYYIKRDGIDQYHHILCSKKFYFIKSDGIDFKK